MDSLRQIEEDLKVLIAEVDRKYPEIATASNTAQQTLKSIRESYISEIRNKDINTKTAKLAQSSDLVAPYILLLNYTDISSKLVESALNGIQLLLKYDVVPPSEVQNVLRVVNIQISCNKFDGYIRTLQLLSSLSSILFNDRSGSHENATFNLINTTLLLADPKLTISVSSAGFATAKQLLCAILDLLISIDKSDPRREWLHPVTLSYIEELTLLGGGCDSKTIKASSNMQAFSFDCLLEISRKYDLLGETFSVQLLQNISSRLLQSLENILKCVQVGFTQQLSSTGIFSALSHLSNVFELVRWVLSRDLWGTKLPENDMHVLMHVLHCLRPEISLDQLDLPKKTLANNDSIFKARMEDAATIFSKISFPFSIAQVIGKTSAPVEYGSGNSLLAFFVEFNDDVVDTPKMLAKSSDKAMSATGNILPIVPAYFALDALLSSCLERFYSLDSARNDLNLFSFLLSNLLAETIKVVVAIRNSEGIR